MDYNLMRIDETFDEDLKELTYKIFGQYRRGLAPFKELNNLRTAAITTEDGQRLILLCRRLYKTYGLKVIARELGITYSDIRKLFSLANINIRTGRNISTDTVKRFRKEKAIRESASNTGFHSADVRRKTINSISRGVQGYYFNKSLRKRVWLRSTYEWVFAKWLDDTNHVWDTECTVYHIDHRKYRPDFFIYDKNNNLVKIVEIKGYWDNNSDKAQLLNDQLENVEVIIITNIKQFIRAGKTYHSELKEWKIINDKN